MVTEDRAAPVLKGTRQGAPGTPLLQSVGIGAMIYRCWVAWEGEALVECAML